VCCSFFPPGVVCWEVLADDEWFVVGVAFVGGVSGKRIIKEGAEEERRLCALEKRRKARAGTKNTKTEEACCINLVVLIKSCVHSTKFKAAGMYTRSTLTCIIYEGLAVYEASNELCFMFFRSKNDWSFGHTSCNQPSTTNKSNNKSNWRKLLQNSEHFSKFG